MITEDQSHRPKLSAKHGTLPEERGKDIVRLLWCVAVCIAVSGCGVTVRSQVSGNSIRLSQFKALYLAVETGGGAISVTNAGMATGMGSGQVRGNTAVVGATGSAIGVVHGMSGDDQVLLAAQDVAFELRQIGMAFP